jgi:hypothetical protein
VQDRLLGFAGVVIVGGAVIWAVAGGATTPVVTLVVIGVVFALADAVVWRQAVGGDLDIPAGQRLPAPPRGLLVLGSSALAVVAARVVDAVLVAGVVGALGVLALGTLARPGGDDVLPSRTVGTARRLRRFVRGHGVEHGQPAAGYLTTTGEPGARLLVVAPDGAWADAVVGDDATTVTRLARITLQGPDDPAIGQRLRIGPRLWTRMTDSW